MPPPFVIVDSLQRFVDGVRVYFERHFDESVRPVVDVGWKRRSFTINQGPGRANRVVILPGGVTGAGGRIHPVRRPTPRDIENAGVREGRVRSVRDWDRIVGISIWAFDPAAPTDELVQSCAAVALFEWVVRAVHETVFADAIWSDVQWTVPKERTFGQEIVVGLVVRTTLFDIPTETAFPSPNVKKEPPPPAEP